MNEISYKRYYYMKNQSNPQEETPPDCPCTHGFTKEICACEQVTPEMCEVCWAQPMFKKGDRVMILDGSSISGYHGSWWAEGMESHIGEICTISSFDSSSDYEGFRTYGAWMNEIKCIWDIRGLKKISD